MEVIANVRYDKLEEIGGKDGQNSKVFRAFDHHLSAELAVKEIEKCRIGDPQRYFREAQAVHASLHPRVVPVYWAATTPDHVCLAMPLMAGSLAQVIRHQPLSPLAAIRAAQDICEGVAQVHVAGFLHLDLKPTNVLVDAHGRYAVTDFGLSLKLDHRGIADARDLALYPSFFPPEVHRDRGAVSHASDVYQVALTIYRAVNGEGYFREQWNRVNVAPWPASRIAIIEGKFPDRTFLPHVPHAMQRAIRRALDVRPEERHVGARQLAEDLAAVIVDHDWQVEVYSPERITWRLRRPGRADVIIRLSDRHSEANVEIWTESEMGTRRKSPDGWSSRLRRKSEIRKALNRAFRAAVK